MIQKKFFILTAVIVMLITAYVVYSKVKSPFKYIDEVNKNLKVEEYKLLAEEDVMNPLLEDTFTHEPGFGMESYINEDHGIKLEFKGFPDVADKYVLTGIEFINPNYSLYGIHPGEKADNAALILAKNGFEKVGEYTYKKGRISVILQINEEDKIEAIAINLESTNNQNIVF